MVIYAFSQILLFLTLFQAYKLVRKSFILRAERVAFDHAHELLAFQGKLGLNFESSWQHWVLDQGDLIRVLNYVYAYYMYGFYACAIVLLAVNPARYRYFRRVFIISMLVALPWYAIYPLAPPRFMDRYGWDFVDTLAKFGPNYFSENGLVTANQYAAMPSMHCGWTLIAGLMIAAALPWPWVGRVLGLSFALLMATVVIATGNHYWLDVLGGWSVVAISLLINRVLPYPFRLFSLGESEKEPTPRPVRPTILQRLGLPGI